jgi:hypothetical protein
MPRFIGGGSSGGRRSPRFVALRPSENSMPKRSLSSPPPIGPPRNCIIIWRGSTPFASWWSLQTSLSANPVEYATTSVTASASVFARSNRIGTATPSSLSGGDIQGRCRRGAGRSCCGGTGSKKLIPGKVERARPGCNLGLRDARLRQCHGGTPELAVSSGRRCGPARDRRGRRRRA